MKVLKKILLVGLLLTTGALLVACSSKKATDDNNTTSTPSAGATDTPAAGSDAAEALPSVVNIGVIAGGPESAILVQEKFLESLGVEANIVTYSAGTDINNAIVSGDVDLACFGSSPIALGIANGISYKAVFVSYLEGGNIEALAVKKEAGVSTVADLKGKTIATPFGTTSHYALLNALKLAGLSASDVTLLDMGGQDIAAAWSRGDIDATYIWSPALDECVKNDGVIITNDGELAEQGITIPEIAVARTEFAEQYPSLVTAYVKALIQVYDVVKNNPDQATSDVAAWEGITEENAKGQVTDNIWVSGEDQLTADYLGTAGSKGKLADTLKTIADFHAEQGNLSSAPDLATFQNAIDTSFVEAALK
jgi:taurine transport system substrate-binding protein